MLQTSNLSIGYRGTSDLVLLEQLNLKIPNGSLTGIIGINGSGKSTLLRTLAGVHPALNGTISIANRSLNLLSPAERSTAISVVFTDPPASGNLSVFDLVSLGRHPYTNWLGKLTDTDTTIIDKCMICLDLQDLSDMPCYTLSDGQLQRALIARALAQDTPLMLLDEPTSHLDLYHKVNIFKALKSIAHESEKTLLFTTHEVDLAIQLCDYLLVMHKGSSFFGTPCDLIEKGVFDQLFPKDTIHFNAEFGRFQVNK
jgi:iron complex transport system ATP-binding protein